MNLQKLLDSLRDCEEIISGLEGEIDSARKAIKTFNNKGTRKADEDLQLITIYLGLAHKRVTSARVCAELGHQYSLPFMPPRKPR
jgi:hypothetical protein